MSAIIRRRFDDNFLLFNFSDADDDELDFGTHLGGQVLHFRPMFRADSKEMVPSIKDTFSACYSLHAWLCWHPKHVAIVSCSDGVRLSGFIVAAYLVFAGIRHDTASSLQLFARARLGRDSLKLMRSWRYLLLNLGALFTKPSRPRVHIIDRLLINAGGLLGGLNAPPPFIEIY